MNGTAGASGGEQGGVPERVGPYALGTLIASGGTGRVFRAVGPGGREAALKLFDALLTDEAAIRRFEKEAAIRIDHPNVVEVLDAGTEGGAPWIALELLDGEPFDARIDRQPPLTPAEVVDLGVQVCRGLEVAHAMGVVHRDLKPENLFLCADGTIKILDFGIALLDTDPERITSSGMIIGTPWYLSPEQARGDEELDTRSDLWSLGCVFYECLAGRTPFERDGMLATVLAIMREELLPLSMLASHVPAPLGVVIERCLVKDRSYRWSSAEALRRALEEVDLSQAPAAAADWHTRPSIAAGEQRVVAVLLAAGTDEPKRLGEAVERHGGTYLPLYGHRAVGLFGSEAWEGDELSRAAAAALEARPTAERLAISAGHATSHGAGISGEALASAEEGVRAQVEGVAIDARSARLLGRRFRLEVVDQDLFRLVERRPPTPIAPLAPPDDPAARFRDSLLPPAPAPSLFGREAEVAQIAGALDDCVDEDRARAVLVVGPTGIGKSRLREEMERLVGERHPEATLLFARGDSLGRKSARAMLAAAIERHARLRTVREGAPGIGVDRPLEERREAVWALARAALRAEALVQETAPFLGELLGVDMGERPELLAARSDPQLMADRLRMAVRDYFAGLCAWGPVILSLEDAHWADAASLSLVEELLELLSDTAFFVFVTARPWLDEGRADFLAEQEALRITPRPLRTRDAIELARSTASRPLPEKLLAAVANRSGGNPLFVEQTVLELLEGSPLEIDEDEELPLPLTVEAAVQSRLDHLPAPEKELCKRAAVLGRPFGAEELGALGIAEAAPLLASLRRRGIITARATSRVGTEREYRFRVALVSEVAYQMLAEDLKAELHRRAAVALDGRTDPDWEEVAVHYDRGGEPARAASRYANATRVAGGRGDFDSVLRCSDIAFYLGVSERHLYDLHAARADALQFMGRFSDQERELEAAMEHARGAEDEAWVLTARIACFFRLGRREEALESAGLAAERARVALDADMEVIARSQQVNALALGGRLEEAAACVQLAEGPARQAGVRARAFFEGAKRQLAEASGDLGEARRSVSEAARLFAEAGDLVRAARAGVTLADSLNRVGAYESAADALRKAVAQCRRLGDKSSETYALFNLGYALSQLGHSREALAAIDDARCLAERTGNPTSQVLVELYDARARLMAGRVQEALARARVAADLAEQTHQPGRRAQALAVTARAHLLLASTSDAHAASGKATAIRDELGGLDEDEADLFLIHADALRVSGDEAAAREVLARGRARLAEIADGIRDPEWRRRFLEDVPANRALLASGPGSAS